MRYHANVSLRESVQWRRLLMTQKTKIGAHFVNVRPCIIAALTPGIAAIDANKKTGSSICANVITEVNKIMQQRSNR